MLRNVKALRGVIFVGLLALLLTGMTLALGLCTGWDTGDMRVKACVIDSPLLRSISNFAHEVAFLAMLLSVFSFGLYPLVGLLVLWLFSWLLAWLICKVTTPTL